ncbi:GcrA cell cycle regulator [Parvibaculum indicum]|uniref:GcrA family cell cycle regulator n=1 Tax=Parvibaculum indicum TaxID=562969 RepID=UPI0014234563|nr:GcrA family cell cycle regulator [Parvibaculum indicum]NIJ40371.1 GcrA cell cycle regulator [Parvibaculum indicum]
MSRAKVWTEAHIDALRKMWADGYSCSQIAKALGDGITRNAVIGKVHRLGLSRRGEGKWMSKSAHPRAARCKPPAAPRGRAAPRKEAKGPKMPGRRKAAEEPVIPPEGVPTGAPEAVMALRGDPRGGGPAQCRFPMGEPSHPDFHFCPNDRVGDGPYCSFHRVRTLEANGTRMRRAARRKEAEAARRPVSKGPQEFVW